MPVLMISESGFEEDVVGDADFPDIVHGACEENGLGLRFVEAEVAGEVLGVEAYPLDVGARFPVPVLGGGRQPVDRLDEAAAYLLVGIPQLKGFVVAARLA